MACAQAKADVHDRFGIDHSTIQVERGAEPATIAAIAEHARHVRHPPRMLAAPANATRPAKSTTCRAPASRCSRATIWKRARRTLTADGLASARRGCGNGASCCRLPEGTEPVSLGEIETPIVAACTDRRGGHRLAGQGRGAAADRIVQGARAGDGGDHGQAIRRSSGSRCRPTAMPAPRWPLMARAAGIETIVICPAETPEINVTETAAYGAKVYVADGQIDECGALVGKGAAAGTVVRFFDLKEPYRIEGKKVMGLELAEQLGWELPDAMFYPTGGGTGLIGMWKAFDELEAVGLIGPERPRMYAVQAEGCAPIVRAFEAGDEFAERWEGAATVATGIRVPKAVGDFLILRAVRESGGAALAVREARSCRRSRMSRATTASCCARGRRGARRMAAGAGAGLVGAIRWCCSTAPTVTNIRWRTGRCESSWRR